MKLLPHRAASTLFPTDLPSPAHHTQMDWIEHEDSLESLENVSKAMRTRRNKKFF